MMKNNKYWQKRIVMLEEAQLKKGHDFYNDLEKQYRIAIANVQRQIESWYQRFADNNEISLVEAKKLLSTKELAEFKWDVETYIKYGRENALNQQWMKELENASARFHISRLEALKLQIQQQIEVLYGNQLDGLDKLARNIYSEGYYHTAYEIQKGFNIGWDLQPINEQQLSAVISKPWTADGQTFKDRCWTNKQQLINSVHTQLTQCIIRGDSPDNAIKTIAEQFNVSKNRAGRLVMTESAFFASQAQKDAFNALDVERFEIVATLDNRTSEICQELDGKIFDMKDYEIGVTAPPFHPWCRTVTVPYFEDDYGERAARGADGKTYYVPSNMKYADWKKTFVNGGSKDGLKEIVPGDNMKIKKTFKEKIQEIKASIANKGGIIEENDIKQAGKLLQDELQMKRADLKAEIETWQKQYKETGIEDIEKQLSKLRQYRGTLKDNATELKEKLSEIRNMGYGSFDVDAHLNNSRLPMRTVIKNAYDYYPTDWIDKSIKKGNLSPKKVNRGYYSDWAGEIAISGWNENSYLGTAIHELGHRFERVIPGILETEKAFYERRTAGEPLKWLGGNYDYSEKARFDKFLNPYMGKDYGGTAYELVSMGFEYAYTNPIKLWEDEDYATWIYGILLLL